jgi:hypothetical protein
VKSFQSQTFYELLEVSVAATDNDIRSAYDRLIRLYSDEQVALYGLIDEERAAALRVKLKEAAEVLLDDVKRAAYDEQIGLPPREPVRSRPISSQAPKAAPTPWHNAYTFVSSPQANTQLPSTYSYTVATPQTAPAPAAPAHAFRTDIPIGVLSRAPAEAVVAPPVVSSEPPANVSASNDDALTTPFVEVDRPVAIGAGEEITSSMAAVEPVATGDETSLRSAGPNIGVDDGQRELFGTLFPTSSVAVPQPLAAAPVVELVAKTAPEPHHHLRGPVVLVNDATSFAEPLEVPVESESSLSHSEQPMMGLMGELSQPSIAPSAPTNPTITNQGLVAELPAVVAAEGRTTADEGQLLPKRPSGPLGTELGKALLMRGEANSEGGLRADPVTEHDALVAPRPFTPREYRPPERPKPYEVPAGVEFNGDLLRQVRMARGLSLIQLSERTRISLRHLENLEGDRYDQLPALVYLRGMLMSLARELGLDALRVSKSYLTFVEAHHAKGKG